MPTPSSRLPVSAKRARRRPSSELDDPLPMVEVVLSGLDGEDWVMETLRSQDVAFRLLACRPTDRGRRRLLRLFEVRTNGEGIGPVVRALRARLSAGEVGAASLGPDRALLRVGVPMPPACAAAFELGDFCISCPFLHADDGKRSASWNVLVPQIADARRLLQASARRGAPRPSLVRAGAYRGRGGLTARQEKALRTAYLVGYFDYPRKASLSAVAAQLGIGRSSALELLRKATAKLAGQRFRAEPSLNHLS